MVLKLKDICLNFIAKYFDIIQNFDHTLLHTLHKEIIIERISNHDWFNLSNKFNLKPLFTNEEYQKRLIDNFFYGHLNGLKFNSCYQLTDSFLNLISKVNHKLFLKSIKIIRCRKITDQGIAGLLGNYSTNLEELVLSHMHIPLSISLCDSVKSLKLHSVDLSFCTTITDKDLWCFCKNNPFIKSLKLTYCSMLTSDGVRLALHMLNKLECLDIESIKDGGTGFFIEPISQNVVPFSSINFKSLKKLSFCGSNELNNSTSMKKLLETTSQLKELSVLYSMGELGSSNYSLQNTIHECPLFYVSTTLVSLSLYRPNIKESNILLECLKRLENLQQLSLCCVECLTDESLNQILKVTGPKLTLLNLGGYMALNTKLTDKALKNISVYCQNLTSINFDLFSPTANFESLIKLFENPKTALKFNDISFSACRGIKYEILTHIAMNCHNLIRINLSGLSELLDGNILDLISMNANKLEDLDIKACSKITDESIINLAINCPLRCLVLSGISSLTDKCIISIANNLQICLQEIYLSGCKNISSVALRYLSDCCVNRLYCEHKVPNLDPNQLMAKNLDTGRYERVDLFYSDN